VVGRLTNLMQRYIDNGRSTPGAPQKNQVTVSLSGGKAQKANKAQNSGKGRKAGKGKKAAKKAARAQNGESGDGSEPE
jgi:hypothetical protein